MQCDDIFFNDIAPGDGNGDCDEAIIFVNMITQICGFDSINSLCGKIGVSENDCAMKDNAPMNLEISDNKKLVLVWIREMNYWRLNQKLQQFCKWKYK